MEAHWKLSAAHRLRNTGLNWLQLTAFWTFYFLFAQSFSRPKFLRTDKAMPLSRIYKHHCTVFRSFTTVIVRFISFNIPVGVIQWNVIWFPNIPVPYSPWYSEPQGIFRLLKCIQNQKVNLWIYLYFILHYIYILYLTFYKI